MTGRNEAGKGVCNAFTKEGEWGLHGKEKLRLGGGVTRAIKWGDRGYGSSDGRCWRGGNVCCQRERGESNGAEWVSSKLWYLLRARTAAQFRSVDVG